MQQLFVRIALVSRPSNLGRGFIPKMKALEPDEQIEIEKLVRLGD
jgi:hypothetical protein